MANIELINLAIDRIDCKLAKLNKPHVISHSMVTEALRQQPHSITVSPQLMIDTLLKQHGDEASCLMPAFLKPKEVCSIDDGVLVVHPSNEVEACVDRFWNWLSTSGKRELLKARSMESALKVVKPFCISKSGVNSNMEVVDGSLRLKLEELVDSFNSQDSNNSCLKVSVEFLNPFVRCCFFARKSIGISLINAVQRFLKYRVELGLTLEQSAKSVLIEGSTTSSSPQATRPLSSFLNKEHTSELELGCRVLSKLLTPIVFVKEHIHVRDIGRFIGKRGFNISCMKTHLETVTAKELKGIKFMLSLSILEASSSVTGVNSRVVTAGVWISHPEEKLLEQVVSQNVDSLISSLIGKEALKSLTYGFSQYLKMRISITDRANSKMVSNSRMPHLIELSHFSHISDKERARKSRYEKEKARWKKMRTLNVRSPITKKLNLNHNDGGSQRSLKQKNLWPVKGMKDIKLCDDVIPEIDSKEETYHFHLNADKKVQLQLHNRSIRLSELKQQRKLAKDERRRQFFALKAGKASSGGNKRSTEFKKSDKHKFDTLC